jgi:hypothetical protein
VAPVAPVNVAAVPCIPCSPVGPVGPVGPVTPASPVEPVVPSTPAPPASPVGPVVPLRTSLAFAKVIFDVTGLPNGSLTTGIKSSSVSVVTSGNCVIFLSAIFLYYWFNNFSVIPL